MLNQGLATQVSESEGPVQMALSIVYLSSPAIGEMLVGENNFRTALDTLGARDDSEYPMLLGLGGVDPFFFRPSGLSFVQDGDTIAVPADDLQMLPLLREGKLQGEVRRTGVLYVAGELDLARPIEVVLDLGPRGETASGIYQVMPPAEVLATQPAPSSVATTDGDGIGSPPDSMAEGGASETTAIQGPVESASTTTTGADGAGPQGLSDVASAPDQQIDYGALLFEDEEAEQSELDRVLERTSWPRVGGFLLLLSLATVTFVTKSTGLRWLTLSVTFILLGYVDGGFLSRVPHFGRDLRRALGLSQRHTATAVGRLYSHHDGSLRSDLLRISVSFWRTSGSHGAGGA